MQARLAGLALALVLAAAATLSAAAADEGDKAKGGPGILSMLPEDSVTRHAVETADGRLAYTATAGTLALRDGDGERVAALYYTAYVLDGAGDRPVTFAFNGGPGAASAYLHLGLAGPRVAGFGPRFDGAAARLADNPDTWLRFTDLVFLDPVGTGWSRAKSDDAAKRFYGTEADAQWLAKAVALWLADNGRLGSPRYLLGESYGGYRAVRVAEALQGEQGIVADGLVMVSPFLDGALIGDATGNALGAALLLPSIAAAELDRAGAFTAEALAAAERFALGDYLVALAGPPDPTVYDRVAALTGLPRDVVARTRGFVADAYREHAARKPGGARISSYDATFARPDPFPADRHDGPDPVLDGFSRALGGLFVGYARDRLGFETGITYRLLSGQVGGQWDWQGGRGSASAVGPLHELMALDPGLRVLVAHGRSDLVTPFGASRYVLDHLPPDLAAAPDGAARARLAVYPGGHMFYFDPAARAAFTADAAAFYAEGAR